MLEFKTKEEAEAKANELDKLLADSKKEIEDAKKEIKEVTRESMSRKDAIKKADEALKKFDAVKEVLKGRGVEDFDGDIGSQVDNHYGKSLGESEKALKSYERRMKQLEESNAQMAKDKAESDKKAAQARFAEVLSKQMTDVIGAQELIDNMILRERVKDDKGKIVCLNAEGDEFSVEKYVEEYKKKNPDRVKVSQQPGGGSAPGKSGNQSPGETGKTIKQSEYVTYNFEAKKKFLANPNNHIEEG